MPRRQAMVMACVCGVLLLLSGCSKKEETSSAGAAASPAASAPAPAPAAAAPASAAAPATAAIQSQDANQAGVVAELTECKRAEGVLTVKVRFRNTSSKELRLDVIVGRNYEAFYVTAANKKYFILKDSEGTYLTPNATGFGNLDAKLEPGQGWLWWAKFPAPPAEVTKMTLITPITPPFEDVPISDK